MPRITALSPTRHRDLKIRQDLVEAQSADARMIPLMLSEFQKAATQYPIVLTKNAETGAFVAVALLGFDAGENLFWRDGQWDGLYVPLNVSRQPFFIGEAEEGKEAFALCIDLDSPCCSGKEGQALFDGEGNAMPYLQRMQATMERLVSGEGETQAFIETLSVLGLLTEVALDIQFENGTKQRVQGIYSIDEAKLNALDAQPLLDLRSKGYLPPIYAMIVSLGQIFGLIQRKNQMHAKAKQWFEAAPA